MNMEKGGFQVNNGGADNNNNNNVNLQPNRENPLPPLPPNPMRLPIHVKGLEERLPAQRSKAMSDSELEELALVDPQKAKRIVANRESAIRSKQRYLHYNYELEQNLLIWQAKVTSLSTQVNRLQVENPGLATENHELELRLQAMELQIGLQDALREALKDEMENLQKIHENNNNGDENLILTAQKLQLRTQHMRELLSQHQQLQKHLFQQQQPQINPSAGSSSSPGNGSVHVGNCSAMNN